MNSGDRVEFDRELAVLFAALDKPVSEARSEAFWRGLAKMSLTDFARCVERLLQELTEGEAPRYFTVSDIWNAKRRLRAPPTVYVHERREAAGTMDGWEVRANRLLLKHLGTRLAADPRAYGPVMPGVPGGTCYFPEQERATAVLVAYKRAWASDMRESADSENSVPITAQQEAWRDCMGRAESEIARLAAMPVLLEAHA